MAKKNSSAIVLLVGVAVILIGAAFYFSQQDGGESLAPDTAITSEEDVVSVEESPDIKIIDIDVSAALSERILGNPEAPVKIIEHSSFTCGHCGQFHQKTFKAFKEAWIDSGKAYLVFSDFPLNAPALHASMIARCLPEDKYFDFVQMLFENQSEWAYDVNYLTYLKQKAAENGLDEDSFKACLSSTALQDGILARVRASQSQWNISSTPSFVINNDQVVSGALSFADFDAAVKAALDPNAAPPAAEVAEPTSEEQSEPETSAEDVPAPEEDATP